MRHRIAVVGKDAVALHREVRDIVKTGAAVPLDLLARGAALTNASSATFDAANNFEGSIPGIDENLAREGLLAGSWCLSDDERLSPGQTDEISLVLATRATISAHA